MKIKTNYVPEGCDYLTVGKVYTTAGDADDYGLCSFLADDGEECLVNVSATGCAHLCLRCWEEVA